MRVHYCEPFDSLDRLDMIVNGTPPQDALATLRDAVVR
jgi:hypothetical protein